MSLFKAGDPFPFRDESRILGVVGDKLVFRSFDTTSGWELWATDGTQEETLRLQDIMSGVDPSDPQSFAVLGDKLIFRANDGTHGYELWVTDGTPAGTQLLKDINEGPGSFYGSWDHQYVFGDRLVFQAGNSTHGVELWVTDGTTQGTMLLADFTPGPDNTSLDGAQQIGNLLFFQFYHDEPYQRFLWVTDGTTGGTQQLPTSENVWIIGAAGHKLIYTDYDGGYRVFATDGTSGGTVQLSSHGEPPYFLGDLEGRLVFTAYGDQLWSTDGTADGSRH